MALTFSEYKQIRDKNNFDYKFNKLCENIVLSNLSFEQYWENYAVPTLLESTFVSNEEQLLNEFFGLFGGKKQAPSQPAPNFDFLNPPPPPPQKPYGSGVSSVNAPGTGVSSTNDPDLIQNYQAMQKDAQERKKAERLGQFQKNIDSQIETVKQRFSTAMKDFLKAMTNDAKQSNDPHMWKIAQNFYKKILSVAQPVVDEFKMQARYGKASYADNFNRLTSRHQQKTQDFYGNLGKSVAGNAPPSNVGGSQSPSPASSIIMPGQQPQRQPQKIWTPG
jgi:hypothetical protein